VVRTERAGHILRILLDRPQAGNAVVEPADLEGAAEALVGRLLSNGPLALRAIKRALVAAQELPLSGGLEVESWEAVALLVSGDAAEGMNAFAERRAPAWTGS
jgi:enoyl-CoA hydratase/carnithine racemase